MYHAIMAIIARPLTIFFSAVHMVPPGLKLNIRVHAKFFSIFNFGIILMLIKKKKKERDWKSIYNLI